MFKPEGESPSPAEREPGKTMNEEPEKQIPGESTFPSEQLPAGSEGMEELRREAAEKDGASIEQIRKSLGKDQEPPEEKVLDRRQREERNSREKEEIKKDLELKMPRWKRMLGIKVTRSDVDLAFDKKYAARIERELDAETKKFEEERKQRIEAEERRQDIERRIARLRVTERTMYDEALKGTDRGPDSVLAALTAIEEKRKEDAERARRESEESRRQSEMRTAMLEKEISEQRAEAREAEAKKTIEVGDLVELNPEKLKEIQASDPSGRFYEEGGIVRRIVEEGGLEVEFRNSLKTLRKEDVIRRGKPSYEWLHQ